jgi:hypothetical protein
MANHRIRARPSSSLRSPAAPFPLTDKGVPSASDLRVTLNTLPPEFGK